MDPVAPFTLRFRPAGPVLDAAACLFEARLAERPVASAMLERFAGMVFILEEGARLVAGDVDLHAVLVGPQSASLQVPRGTSLASLGQGEPLVAEGLPEELPMAPVALQALARFLGGTEFRLRLSPGVHPGQVGVVLQDESPRRRREVLEDLLWTPLMDLVQEVRREGGGAEEGTMATEVLALAGELSLRRMLARVRAGGGVHRVPVDLSAFFEEMRVAFRRHPLAAGRRMDLECPPGSILETDPVLLAQALMPMIHNALEASRPGDVVRVWLAEREGAPVIQVSNPGLVPRQVAGRLFQPSFTTKSAAARGMGIFTMRHAGELLLGGRVGYTSKVGEGTVFYLQLPAEAFLACGRSLRPIVPSQDEPAQAPRSRVEGMGGRLLVVDDSRTILSILTKVLGEEHDVHTATTGAEALSMARQLLPDLILLDVVMPGMDGYEVCGKLKAEPELAPIPVIFLSSMRQEEDEAVGLALGAIDYLAKPISPAIVTMRVRNHIALKRYRDLLEARSYQDGLTGIPNRRRFDEMLAREWARAQRQGEKLSLLLGDVDHFKRYNDGYGHLEGDGCLQTVAQTLAGCLLRPTDLGARYGGEEFAVLLPGTDEGGALQVAERILASVRALGRPHAFSPVAPHVTLSLGAATLQPAPDQPASALVGAADQALYGAKEAGRDRVLAWDGAGIHQG